MRGAGAVGERSGWDQRLMTWPRANLLQGYRWGEIQVRAGWSAKRRLVPTSAGALPVTALVGGGGLPGLRRVYVPRGPASDPGDLATFERVVADLVALGRAERALSLELEVPWFASELASGHPFLGWGPAPARQPLATVAVDLGPEPEAILASFNAKTRYNVRLAERRGVEVRSGSVEELVSCVRATEARQGIHLPSEQHLRAVVGVLEEAASVLVAAVDEEVVAGILLARFGGEVTYLYGGASGRHRQLMPNHLLHWRAMMRAREDGCTAYDLWGIPETDRPDHPWHGLAQFKMGFGGRRLLYAGCRRLDLVPGGGRLLTVADRARRQARRRWRR